MSEFPAGPPTLHRVHRTAEGREVHVLMNQIGMRTFFEGASLLQGLRSAVVVTRLPVLSPRLRDLAEALPGRSLYVLQGRKDLIPEPRPELLVVPFENLSVYLERLQAEPPAGALFDILSLTPCKRNTKQGAASFALFKAALERAVLVSRSSLFAERYARSVPWQSRPLEHSFWFDPRCVPLRRGDGASS